jgi:hypothetical protein
VLGLHALNDTGNDVALAVRELLEHHLTLGLTESLKDDLFCRLGGDATRLGRVHFIQKNIAGHDVRLAPAGVGKADFYLIVGDFLNDRALKVDVVIAGLAVDADGNVA